MWTRSIVHTTYEDGTVCSETSAHKIQTPGNHPKERIHHLQQGECLKFVIMQTLELILYTSTQHGTWVIFNPRPSFEGVTKATEHHISEQPVCVPIFEIWRLEIRAGMLASQPCFKVLIPYLPRGTVDFYVNTQIDQYNSTGNKSKK